MKYRALVVAPVALALAFLLVEVVVGGMGLSPILVVENEAGKALALAGAVAAAAAFERGDYLRRSWSYGAASMILLLANDAFRAALPAAPQPLHDLALVVGVIALLANAAAVVNTFTLARAWDVAGLADDRGRRRAMLAGAMAVSLAVTGWPLT